MTTFSFLGLIARVHRLKCIQSASCFSTTPTKVLSSGFRRGLVFTGRANAIAIKRPAAEFDADQGAVRRKYIGQFAPSVTPLSVVVRADFVFAEQL
jgi:hypothetical protein